MYGCEMVCPSPIAIGSSLIRHQARFQRNELLARNLQHGGQHPLVANAAPAKLRIHHSAAFRRPIGDQVHPQLYNSYMMAHLITLIPGDGIGPEVADATVRAVDATGVAIEWERVEAGVRALAEQGQLIPDDVFASLEVTRVGLKGPTATPIGGGHQSINVALRKKLGLYTNFRPVRMLPGLKTRFHDLALDLAIFRENTEDLYSGLEHEVVPGVVESLKIITQKASTQIARSAFEWARRESRKKVVAIHKANIMKMSDGLFLKCCREVASHFPDIQYSELIVDNACMQLVMRPETFDVLVLPNLYGDIISDLTAGLVGGLGIVPGANIGDHHAIFEAVHGTAPDIAGKGLANPTALMQSAVLMLAHIGERDASSRLHNAIYQTYAEARSPHRRCGRQFINLRIHRRRDPPSVILCLFPSISDLLCGDATCKTWQPEVSRAYCVWRLRISRFRRVNSEPNLLPKSLAVVKPAMPQPHSPFGKHMTRGSTALRTPQTSESFRTAHLCKLRWHRCRTELCLESS